jgi:undecaprenyl-diphosphatase
VVSGVDYSIYKAIDAGGPSALNGLARFCANDLVFVIVAIVALTFLIPWRDRRLERRIGAVLATAAGGIALLIAQPIANAVDRTRPFITHPHATLLIHHANDAGFPSDHATGAFGLAMGLWLYDRAIGALTLFLAVIVALARVYVGAHYPSDVVAGALLGIAVALVLYLTPLRAVIARIASLCSSLWERILGFAPARSSA